MHGETVKFPSTSVYRCHFWLSFVTADICDGYSAVEWGTLVEETERRCVIAKTYAKQSCFSKGTNRTVGFAVCYL